MDECPTIQELAAYVEGSSVPAGLRDHVESCAACRASLETLRGEVQTLRISISELWFSEKVSCPAPEVLAAWQAGKLKDGLGEYVAFHVDDLGCTFCQAELGNLEVSRDRKESQRRSRSREKVGEATAILLEELRGKR